MSDYFLPFVGSPSAPRELTAAGSGSKVMLHWLPPSNTGGRDDVLYVVTCEQCLPDQMECQPCDASIHFSENPRHLKATALTVSGLEPHLNYTFTVEARNGVSRTKTVGTHATLRVSLNQTGKGNWPCVCSRSNVRPSGQSYVRIMVTWNRLTSDLLHISFRAPKGDLRQHGQSKQDVPKPVLVGVPSPTEPRLEV